MPSEVLMRIAENFNPEWGYLAPAPSFMRTARIVVVAATIGASAGGAVVFSLIERPLAEEPSVAARTMAAPDGAAAMSARLAAVTQANTHEQRQLPVPQAVLAIAHAATGEEGSTVVRQAGRAVLAESPAMTDKAPPAAADRTATAADAPPPAKKVAKIQQAMWQRFTWHNAPRAQQSYGAVRRPLPLFAGPANANPPPRGVLE
jgi:hypothetical protein